LFELPPLPSNLLCAVPRFGKPIPVVQGFCPCLPPPHMRRFFFLFFFFGPLPRENYSPPFVVFLFSCSLFFARSVPFLPPPIYVLPTTQPTPMLFVRSTNPSKVDGIVAFCLLRFSPSFLLSLSVRPFWQPPLSPI